MVRAKECLVVETLEGSNVQQLWWVRSGLISRWLVKVEWTCATGTEIRKDI